MNREEVLSKVKLLKKAGYLVPNEKIIKTPEQIECIKASAKINTLVLDEVAKVIKEGMSTQDIDDIVASVTKANGAICAPLNYDGFTKSVCTSINEVVCHGIPTRKRILRSGDIINVDVSTLYKGYYSDASRMFLIGNVPTNKQDLVRVTKECLEIGLQQVKPFKCIGDIGAAIEAHAKKHNYSVVREFCGHGVGLEFHEDPYILHYGKINTGMIMVPGMIFTIEPMINMGRSQINISKKDGWTVTSVDGKASAQWEYTVLVTEDGYEVLTY